MAARYALAGVGNTDAAQQGGRSSSNSSTPPAMMLGAPTAAPTATVGALQAALEASERRAQAVASERDAAIEALGAIRERYLQTDSKLREVATSLAAVLGEREELKKDLEGAKHEMRLRSDKHCAAMAKVNERVNVAARIDHAIVRLYLMLRYHATSVGKLPQVSEDEVAEVRRAQPLSTLHLCQEWLGRLTSEVVAKKSVEEFLHQFLKARTYAVQSPLPPTLALTNVINGVHTVAQVGSKKKGLLTKKEPATANGVVPHSRTQTPQFDKADGEEEEGDRPAAPPQPSELPPWVILFIANTDVLEGKGGAAAEAEAREKTRAANATRSKFQQIAQLAHQQALAQVAAMADDPMKHLRSFDGHASRHVKDFPEAILIIDKLNDKLDQLVRVMKELEERHHREVTSLIQKEEEVRGTSTQGALRSLREQLREKDKQLEECSAEIRRYKVNATDYVIMQREVNEANERALHSKIMLEQRAAELLRTQRGAIERSIATKDAMKSLASKADGAAKLESENSRLTKEVRDLSSQLRRLDLAGLRDDKERAISLATEEGAKLREAESALLTAEARSRAMADANQRMTAEYNAIFKAHMAAIRRQKEAETHETELESKQFVLGDRSPLMAEHYLGKYQEAMRELNQAQRKLRHLLMVAHHDQSSSAKRIANLEEDLVKEKGARWSAEVSMQQQTETLLLSQSQQARRESASPKKGARSRVGLANDVTGKQGLRKSTLTKTARALMAGTHALSRQARQEYEGGSSGDESGQEVNTPAQRLIEAVSNVTVSAQRRTVTIGDSSEAKVTLDAPSPHSEAQEGLPPPSHLSSTPGANHSTSFASALKSASTVTTAMTANWIAHNEASAFPSNEEGSPEVSSRRIPKAAVTRPPMHIPRHHKKAQ